MLKALLRSLLLAGGLSACGSSPVDHDVHERHPLGSAAENDVRSLAVTRDGVVIAATAAGARRLDPVSGTWSPLPAPGPAFCVTVDPGGQVWIGAWDGLYRGTTTRLEKVEGIGTAIGMLAHNAAGVAVAGGPDGFVEIRGSKVLPLRLGIPRYPGRLLAGKAGDWWFATGMGLFRWNDQQAGDELSAPIQSARVSASFRGAALDAGGRLWAAASGGVQVYRGNRLEREIAPADGLPSGDVRCVARATGTGGPMWVGTALGVARENGGGWDVRHGRRWLLHDEVRDISFGPDGTAWIATAGGVSALKTRAMTLEAKAAHFQGILDERHVRPPGIVEKCRLRTPGDPSSWTPTDDDNDGGYTALAMAMEAYRHAVTRDPSALAAARRGLSACEFLLRVSGTRGFLARTVVPTGTTDVHDTNLEMTPAAQAEERLRDPRDKYVPVRWRPSADGKWLWKGDTSSDEVTAHFFSYFAFHQLADDPADRDRLRVQICRIVDHLLEHGLVLQDDDGRPTRWGIWAPEYLNHDPNWAMERGINSVEILSYLKLAHHVSGATKYSDAYQRLIRDHHYDRNVLEAPNLNPGWRTYIDFELLAFAYPALLALERDTALRRIYLRSFERWHETVKNDGNPFFEYLYATYGARRGARLDASLSFLRETPLDLVRWDVDLTRREDLKLRRWPEVDRWQTDRLLPASEIGYSRTDQNPWASHHGEGAQTESDGVFWLLPYWMGRHHGYIPN